jgi:hypothetical protein
MNAQALITRIGKLATKLNTSNRTIYKRISIREGGDDLIGRPGIVTHTDTVLDPPPVVSTVSAAAFRKQDLSTSYASMLFTGQATDLVNAYLLTISPEAMSRQDIKVPDLSFVFKDDSTQEEEVYDLISYYPVTVGGTDVVIYALVRSKARPVKG